MARLPANPAGAKRSELLGNTDPGVSRSPSEKPLGGQARRANGYLDSDVLVTRKFQKKELFEAENIMGSTRFIEPGLSLPHPGIFSDGLLARGMGYLSPTIGPRVGFSYS